VMTSRASDYRPHKIWGSTWLHDESRSQEALSVPRVVFLLSLDCQFKLQANFLAWLIFFFF
jgi:hypothetical protein